MPRPGNHDKSQQIWKQFETSRHVEFVAVYDTSFYLQNEICPNVVQLYYDYIVTGYNLT